VVLCTDGLANTGIGSLEGKKDDYTPFYTELAEQVNSKVMTNEDMMRRSIGY
jgi:hypothetical protein